MHILIIKLGAFGDIAQSFGLIKAVRSQYPDARITVLTRPMYQALVASCPYVDTVVTTFSAVDIIIDLQNNKRTNRWAMLNRVLWRKPWFGTTFFATHRVTPDYTNQQAFYADADILQKAGVNAIEPDDFTWMQGSAPINLPKPYALIVPGCSPEHPEKRWPVDGFIAVSRFLAARGVTPVVLGGSSEQTIAAHILNAVPEAVSLVQQTKMTDMPELARHALCAVGNDTGPMHLIGPTGCKTLVLFGAGGKLGSNPVRHRPLGAQVQTLQASPIEAITSTEVIEKLAAWHIAP